ncbi:hypothetical protein G3A_02440 [Bacillus sp. 17376]|uniref:Flagellar assembly factor FliW n=1 Tax=Mesobacillus boroniphilus JCM 21738 TaxID=1294265 RepID=W4RIU8_9BACI|nr:flagellar assembly protein FliW [Mesobacillus boroniphilus]ESU34146.1 hypothetical protein G3A_02440 [Bacillus sp. 17376]GAE44062.1 flagellar assembly factor FliW [Mesobacillus boroniphilus JCM 21738]
MKINTKYHGEVEVEVEEILTFEKGIPGFVEETQFALLPLSDDESYFVLQSVSNPGLAFVLTNPFHFMKEYDFQLEDATVEELNLEREKDVAVFSILTVQDPFEKTTANLQAPIIINQRNRKAKQVILHEEQYKTKHPIFKKAEAKG